jgi:uncharacterized phage protein gp47/JayE
MKIDSTGFELSKLQDYLQSWQDNLKTIFGDDFVIKKEGVIDNIATSSSLSCMDLENQIAFLIKQLNPYTAEDEWQDRLYSLIGLVRQQATYTVVSRTCEGTANSTITAGTLIIENASTKDQFRLNSNLTFDANGYAIGSFTAEESGAINLPNDAVLNIITPLTNLRGVYYSAGNTIIIGKDYESNSEFRERWQLSSAQVNANTDNSLYKALLELVDNKTDLKIFTNRTSSSSGGIPAHSQKIVIYSPYDNQTIAQAIFDNIVDGNMVGLQGTTSVDITDSQGSTETIKFERATEVSIYIKAEVVLNNASLSSVSALIKQSIIDYANNTTFEMGQKLLANMFISPIYNNEEVSEVASIKLSTNGTTWVDYVQLGTTEVPVFDIAKVTINEAS